MTTEERREYERKRWHRRYADPEFRKREKERSRKRMAEYLADDKNRERWNASRREWYKKNRERIREYQRKWREQKKAKEELVRMKPEAIKPRKHKTIKPSDEWQKICKIVKQAKDQFLQVRPGELSSAAKAILAYDYTPEGRAVKELMEQINKEAK